MDFLYSSDFTLRWWIVSLLYSVSELHVREYTQFVFIFDSVLDLIIAENFHASEYYPNILLRIRCESIPISQWRKGDRLWQF